MTENLVAGLGSGLDIETNTESMILLDFIRDNWTLADPAAAAIDFGASPKRTTKDVTLNCWRRSSIITDQAVGATSYKFNVLVAVDTYMRETASPGLKDAPARLMAVESYLREFFALNRIGLWDKGIKSISLERIENPPDPSGYWYRSLLSVRCVYSMFKVTS